MTEWYEYPEDQRTAQVYSKFTINDFWQWWSSGTREWMEIRIRDKPPFDLIRGVAEKFDLNWCSSGVFINNAIDLKNVIANIRDKATCWFSINPRKRNWSNHGKMSLGGKLTNVLSINFLFIDIDRLVKIRPANSDELMNADVLANRILEKLGQQGWNKNYCKICSGNGVQLLIKLDYPIKMPVVEFDTKTKDFFITDEFNSYADIMKNKIGRQLAAFANKAKEELRVDVDKACFNVAGVGALPVTKNYKFDSFRWRGVVELKAEGENTGLTDYIVGGLSQTGKSNIFVKPRKMYEEDKLTKGKLKEHPLVKFMMQELPPGSRNNKLWFQFKCLLRDSNIDLNSDEFKEMHRELERLWKDTLTLNLPKAKFTFSRAIINSYCVDNLIAPVYLPLYQSRTAPTYCKLENVDFEVVFTNVEEPLDLKQTTTIEEDMEEFSKTLVPNSYANFDKYMSFLKGCIRKYGVDKTRYYSTYVFKRIFCWK